MRVMGVDAGVSGAAAVLDSAGEIKILDLPLLTITVGRGERTILDINEWLATLRFEQGFGGLDKYLLEKGQGVRGQSAPASYGYGFTNGSLFTAALSLGIPSEQIEPGIWKRAMRLIGKEKDDSIKLASELFPSVAQKFRHGRGVGADKSLASGRAEAALIAYYELHRRG